MAAVSVQLRRAVIDDLPSLMPLWRRMNFPAEELEKRFAEFQIAVDGQGRVLGALALTIADKQGWIRHEAFDDFGLADSLREQFWGRIQNLAANYGLLRLWTQETSHFWRELEFLPADAAALEKLPAEWRSAQAEAPWQTLPLRAEIALKLLSETGDVEALMKLHREEAARNAARVKRLHAIAMGLAFLLAALVLTLIIYMFKRDPGLLRGILNRG